MRRLIFGIAPRETTVAARGFDVPDPVVRERLELVGGTFVEGYHAALELALPDLGPRLEMVENERRGWAYEGAAMALALLDGLTPFGGGRSQGFLEGPGLAHAYMVYVGFGWARARLPRFMAGLRWNPDPLLRWLILDGHGFHDGYFHARRSIEQQVQPRGLSGYAARAFDQGLGRGLWFAAGAEIDRITRLIGAFAAPRRADLWSGIGLACAYAGGVSESRVCDLRCASAESLPHVAQGAAFAAKARLRAGNPAPHTEMAARVLCRMSLAEAAEVTDRERPAEPTMDTPGEPAYEQWRCGIRTALAAGEVAA